LRLNLLVSALFLPSYPCHPDRSEAQRAERRDLGSSRRNAASGSRTNPRSLSCSHRASAARHGARDDSECEGFDAVIGFWRNFLVIRGRRCRHRWNIPESAGHKFSWLTTAITVLSVCTEI